MSHRPDDQEETPRESKEGSVSEGGSGALNAQTAQGGADSVPDTPDVNTEISDAVEPNVPGESPGSEHTDEGAPGPSG